MLSEVVSAAISFQDVLGGTLVAMLVIPLVVVEMDLIEYFLFHAPSTPLYLVLMVILLLYVYPVDPHSWSKDRGDTAAILGTSVGIMLGHCANGTFPDDLDSGPFPLAFPSVHTMSLCIVRFVVGLLLVLPTRFVMKLLCYKLLPRIMPTHGVREVAKRPLVELPYKIITYSAIGFNVLYLSNVVFEICGISRFVDT